MEQTPLEYRPGIAAQRTTPSIFEVIHPSGGGIHHTRVAMFETGEYKMRSTSHVLQPNIDAIMSGLKSRDFSLVYVSESYNNRYTTRYFQRGQGRDAEIIHLYYDPPNKSISVEHVRRVDLPEDIDLQLFLGLWKHTPQARRTVGIIIKTSRGYALQNIDTKDIKIDFDLYYNDNFKFQELDEILKADKPGLVLLSGIPGSGKSSLIKYLLAQSNEKFCIMPPHLLSMFEDPGAMEFILDDLKDKTIIVEDGEAAVKDRNEMVRGYTSALLNITDGIVGDNLNIKMIVTLNITEKIDPALLRKGRLIYSHHFEKLSVERANALATFKGFDVVFTEPQALTDVLNWDKPDHAQSIVQSKGKIGFFK
jgi:hypothetical protein